MKRQLVGSRNSIDIRGLVRAGLRSPGDALTAKWHSSLYGEQTGSALATLLDAERLHIVHFNANMPAEVLDLTYTRTAFGGKRAWFVCSKLGCGKRVAILHATSKGLRCRHCTHLAYGSQVEQPYDRSLRAARRVRYRLGGSSNLLEAFPDKPKGMHQTNYASLMLRENQLWRQIQNVAMKKSMQPRRCL